MFYKITSEWQHHTYEDTSRKKIIIEEHNRYQIARLKYFFFDIVTSHFVSDILIYIKEPIKKFVKLKKFLGLSNIIIFYINYQD